jgi:hypothetical protein
MPPLAGALLARFVEYAIDEEVALTEDAVALLEPGLSVLEFILWGWFILALADLGAAMISRSALPWR